MNEDYIYNPNISNNAFTYWDIPNNTYYNQLMKEQSSGRYYWRTPEGHWVDEVGNVVDNPSKYTTLPEVAIEQGKDPLYNLIYSPDSNIESAPLKKTLKRAYDDYWSKEKMQRLSDIYDWIDRPVVEATEDAAWSTGRPHYYPRPGHDKLFANTLEDFLSEAAHPIQLKHGNVPASAEIIYNHDGAVWSPDYDKRGGSTYAYPDRLEYETHSVFEPQLKSYLRNKGNIKSLDDVIEEGRKASYNDINTYYQNKEAWDRAANAYYRFLNKRYFQDNPYYINPDYEGVAWQKPIFANEVMGETPITSGINMDNNFRLKTSVSPDGKYRIVEAVDLPPQKYAKGGSIHINPANKGKFNATKRRTGKTTEELTHSKNPLTRKRAIFAQNARKWKHADGGYLEGQEYDVTPEEYLSLIQQGYKVDLV